MNENVDPAPVEEDGSEFKVRVVRLGPIVKHPNADTLSYTDIGGPGGYRVILRTGEYVEGQLAVYVPVTAAVPADDPRWSFLVKQGSTKTHVEIEAKRLRQVFSMGILTAADPSWEEGREVATELRITRVEETEHDSPQGGGGDGDFAPDPGVMPVYGVSALRAYPNVLQPGEEVSITEKLHGQNARFCFSGGALHVGSRNRWKDAGGQSVWAQAAQRLGLEERLRGLGVGIYGELYGNVAGMRYDATADQHGLRLFDAINLATREYLDVDDFLAMARGIDLPTVPVLYRGPWNPEILRALADGPSTLAPKHVREGFVVKPVVERRDHCGRCIFKCHGSEFLLKNWAIK